MSEVYKAMGKEVLRDGKHFADVVDSASAAYVAALLNSDLATIISCRACQMSDQMVCPCGLRWDMNDPEPPACPR